MLKTEEARKITSSVINDEPSDKRSIGTKQQKTISRNSGSMFRRF